MDLDYIYFFIPICATFIEYVVRKQIRSKCVAVPVLQFEIGIQWKWSGQRVSTKKNNTNPVLPAILQWELLAAPALTVAKSFLIYK